MLALDREMANDLGPHTIVNNILQYVMVELNDPDFHEALATIGQLSHAIQMKGETLKVQLATYQPLQLRNLLTAPALLQGRDNPKIIIIARDLIVFLRNEFRQDGAIRGYYCHAYTETLSLVAWVLPLKKISKHTSSRVIC
jgi:hypothetical protein